MEDLFQIKGLLIMAVDEKDLDVPIDQPDVGDYVKVKWFGEEMDGLLLEEYDSKGPLRSFRFESHSEGSVGETKSINSKQIKEVFDITKRNDVLCRRIAVLNEMIAEDRHFQELVELSFMILQKRYKDEEPGQEAVGDRQKYDMIQLRKKFKEQLFEKLYNGNDFKEGRFIE